MFGIGGGELIFILFIVLMLFGSEKVPEIARTMGKAMAQLKNATNDIKNEIHKGAAESGIDQNLLKDISSSVTSEINNAKDKLIGDDSGLKGIKDTFTTEIDQTKKSVLNETTISPNDSKITNSGSNTIDEKTISIEKSDDIVEETTGPIKRKK